MRALMIAGLMCASFLTFAPSATAHDEECTSIFNCNIENAPPNCVGGWTGTIHYHLAGFSFTIHYCAYQGPEW